MVILPEMSDWICRGTSAKVFGKASRISKVLSPMSFSLSKLEKLWELLKRKVTDMTISPETGSRIVVVL